MAKRSKKVQELLDWTNSLLVLEKIWTMSEHIQPDESPEAQSYKQGLVAALEHELHRSNCYRGFMYLKGDNPKTPFTRKYF